MVTNYEYLKRYEYDERVNISVIRIFVFNS